MLFKKPFKSKEYYDNCFTGDIRQLLNQAKLNIVENKDEFFDKSNILKNIISQKYVKISDISIYTNILLESYIHFNDEIKKSFVKRMTPMFNVYKDFYMNYYLRIYYPCHIREPTFQEYDTVQWEKSNLNWTRLSNIKYRKKSFQTIRRALKPEFIGFEKYYKIVEIRNSIMLCIKEKRISDAVEIMDYYGLPYKLINHMPKLQIGDEYHSYISRLKPFNSYINKYK